MSKRLAKGFTIVELLIVVVVIAILAAISIVTYSNIQNRANDTAVQSDLQSFGKKFIEFDVLQARLPHGANTSDISPMGLKPARDSYGNHFVSGGNEYNMAYCRSTSTANAFAVVAASKSGNIFVFNNGAVKPGVGPLTSIATTCSNNGIADSTVSNSIWLYNQGEWRSGIN